MCCVRMGISSCIFVIDRIFLVGAILMFIALHFILKLKDIYDGYQAFWSLAARTGPIDLNKKL